MLRVSWRSLKIKEKALGKLICRQMTNSNLQLAWPPRLLTHFHYVKWSILLPTGTPNPSDDRDLGLLGDLRWSRGKRDVLPGPFSDFPRFLQTGWQFRKMASDLLHSHFSSYLLAVSIWCITGISNKAWSKQVSWFLSKDPFLSQSSHLSKWNQHLPVRFH